MPVLVVQKGHCYRTTGATGTSGEQQYATSVANACVNLLHGRKGWTVRAILADAASSAYDGDAFVAIHCDGSTSTSARGASIGYRNAAGQSFGQAWKRAYAARGWTGGFRPDNYTEALHLYYGTGTAISMGNPRAFIAECGFLTNAQDRALLTGPGGPTRVALAIGDALGITVPQEDSDMELTDTVDWQKVNDAGPTKLGWSLMNTRDNAKVARENSAAAVGMLKSLAQDIDDAEARILGAVSTSGGAAVDVTVLADALAGKLGPDLGRELVEALVSALAN